MLEKLKTLKELLLQDDSISYKIVSLVDEMIQELEAPKIILTELVNTCSACPSQWDAADAEGNQYYIRFRHGYGRVERNGVTIIEWNYRQEFGGDDGYITEEDMLKVTKMEYKPS